MTLDDSKWSQNLTIKLDLFTIALLIFNVTKNKLNSVKNFLYNCYQQKLILKLNPTWFHFQKIVNVCLSRFVVDVIKSNEKKSDFIIVPYEACRFDRRRTIKKPFLTPFSLSLSPPCSKLSQKKNKTSLFSL